MRYLQTAVEHNVIRRAKNEMTRYHLAQINIAHAQASMDSALMKGFVDRLAEINALADNSPGFVWRLQTEEGDATALQVFDDPLLIVNMSVWENIGALIVTAQLIRMVHHKISLFDTLFYLMPAQKIRWK